MSASGQGLSNIPGSAVQPVEHRSFVAAHAGSIWYGDVMHGPKVLVNGRMSKVYQVSFMDDASRLITHSAFCPAETALEVEGVLKQALLKRGIPGRLVIDNGAAYRAATRQAICAARLEIRLIYTPTGSVCFAPGRAIQASIRTLGSQGWYGVVRG